MKGFKYINFTPRKEFKDRCNQIYQLFFEEAPSNSTVNAEAKFIHGFFIIAVNIHYSDGTFSSEIKLPVPTSGKDRTWQIRYLEDISKDIMRQFREWKAVRSFKNVA